MKIIARIIALAVLAFAIPLATTSCQTPPTERRTEVATLKVVGEAGASTMRVSAQLLKDRKITTAQWDRIASYYDTKFQPAYRIAVTAVKSDLSSPASRDLLFLLGQLSALAASFQPQP